MTTIEFIRDSVPERGVVRLADLLLRTMRGAVNALRTRRCARDMLEFSDGMLRDIGISRDELHAIADGRLVFPRHPLAGRRSELDYDYGPPRR